MITIPKGLVPLLFAAAILTACGGGGGSTQLPENPPPPPSPQLAITTGSNLPGTLTNSSYTETLQAINGVGTLTWSIAPTSPTALFVDGLSIDPATGVISGTVAFSGTAGFLATVRDSNSHVATKGFTITGFGPLQPVAPQLFQVGLYQQITPLSIPYTGGVQPWTYSISAGSLPTGLRFNAAANQITGSAITAGLFPLTVTIEDSYTPPEVTTAQVTVQVIPPPLSLDSTLPRQILLNRPFSGRVVGIGGTPPYLFSVTGGSLPTGLSVIDPHTGQFNGSPTASGPYLFTVSVTDSSIPPHSFSNSFFTNVVAPIGRNDTVATATLIGNGSFTASISPYIDPPTTPAAGDNDYYKLVSLSGATVHIETFAQRAWTTNPLDTVLEIVDGNGTRLTTCRAPNSTAQFTSQCLNDDLISQATSDSALDFKVPGAPSAATTFYAHVLDWRGDARPDMNYQLSVSGVAPPMSIQSTPLIPAARGLSYSQQLVALDGIGTVNWTISSGSLPPGLSMSSGGAISGAATTNGRYTFSATATDSANPPQTATVQESIQVVDPLQITSSATMPDACFNQPYTFAVHTTGGIPQLSWGLVSNTIWVLGFDQSTGMLSGSPSLTGTFSATVGVTDATQHGASQVLVLNVVPCG